MSKKFKKGFTLLELLVVVAIIGILSAVVLMSINKARAKARDAKRLSDIKQIQTALDRYYIDHGEYPVSFWADADSISSSFQSRWLSLENILSPYIKELPQDPKNILAHNVATDYSYTYYGDFVGKTGQWYMIIFRLENKSNPIQNYDGVTACDGRYFHYGNNSNGIITIGKSCIN